LPFWQELPLLVLIAFSLALLIKTFLLQAFFIPSGSMQQTLEIKDRVLVNKIVYDFRTPQRGEVIVFRGVDSWAPEVTAPPPEGLLGKASQQLGSLVGLAQPDEKDFIKRVIGTPGDVVRCCDAQGRVLVNNVPLDEPYVFENTAPDQRPFGPITVPAGRLFVMGDHRGFSQDSRAYINDQFKGTVPINQVIGRAFVKVWPVARWGGLEVPETWQFVPQAQASGQPRAPADAQVGAAASTGGPVIAAVLLLPLRWRRRRRTRTRGKIRGTSGGGAPASGRTLHR
jgi:signal peptidase I